jgi:hypothetical protein
MVLGNQQDVRRVKIRGLQSTEHGKIRGLQSTEHGGIWHLGDWSCETWVCADQERCKCSTEISDTMGMQHVCRGVVCG